MKSKKITTEFIAQAAIIAALYIALVYLFIGMSFLPFQARVAEALCILPAFTFAAVPGLFIGCLLSNILGGLGMLDIIFGSLATLLAAYLAYKIPKNILKPLPAVVINAIVVPIILYYTVNAPILLTALEVFLGQTISCYGLGVPLMYALKRSGFMKHSKYASR